MNTYRKLFDDSWGVRVSGAARPGDQVTVTKKSGATKVETLGEMLAADSDGALFRIVQAPLAPAQTAEIGSLAMILSLFGKARQHLKFPAIVLAIGSDKESETVRINVAGPQSSRPGTLNVASVDRDGVGERAWFGRINLDGVFESSRKTSPAKLSTLVPALQRFAADPAGEAKRSARLTGRCCFCNRPLTDERSTAVGYGKTCADHFGLAWGVDKTDLRQMVGSAS